MELYIARHVITESNKKRIYMGWSEEGLALEGREQAEALGQSLQSLELQQIYSSPLRSALETSEIIGQLLRVHIIL
jgi:alpha-ribazole phosphatase